MGCKNPGDSPRKGKGWCLKENVNEECWQIKNNNNKMKIKNGQLTSLKPPRGSPKQVQSLRVFWLLILKNYYKINCSKKMITKLIITKKVFI